MNLPVRPTTEFTLKCGWKVTLVDYFTQGEFDAITRLLLDAMKNDPTTGKLEYMATGSVHIEQNNLAKKFAVTSLTDEKGTVWSGEALTLDVLLSIPYDATDGDELKELIDTHCLTPKKKPTDATS